MKIIPCILLLAVLSGTAIDCAAGPGNIAPLAKVTASTSLNRSLDAANVTDGWIGIDGKGEWACEGDTTDWGYIRLPWIQLEWTEPQLVDKVILYDRASLHNNIAGGKLLFSDGSVVWVNQVPADGTGRPVSFPARSTKWIKFVVSDATGRDIGLSEIEVFPSRQQSKDYVSWVDPYIETNRGRYFFFITGNFYHFPEGGTGNNFHVVPKKLPRRHLVKAALITLDRDL